MIVQLVSYQHGKTEQKRLQYAIELINQSTADLLMFSGHTLFYKKDLLSIKRCITNHNVAVLFETRENDNHLYRIQCGKVVDMRTNQMFATSQEIEKNLDLAKAYIKELKTKRLFQVNKKQCLVIQCGENNILRNYQKDYNRAVFRFNQYPELEEEFLSLLDSVDIVLNPIHLPMGNQGKMAKRRELFSSNGRAYFSACNADKNKKLLGKSIQYGYQDGIALTAEPHLAEDNGFVTRIFSIE